jgi:Putative peptidoglycan binding domain/Protein of unknown function (DUF1036)
MRLVAALIASTLAVMGLTDEAKSDLNLCNNTPWWLDVSLTYGVPNGYSSVGAPRLLLPGHCKTLLHGPTKLSVEYYVAAYPASGVYEQDFDWLVPASHGLCNADGQRIFFKKDDPQPCSDESLTFADWFQIMPDSADFSFEFHSNENFTLEQAQIAGAQQFLNLLGYDVGPVDGIVGTRTSRSLSRYQKDSGFRPDGRLTNDLLEGMASALRRAYASEEIVLQRPTSH